MSQMNPVVERYLSRFAGALAAVPDEERYEMVREIRSHIAEALHTGRDITEVLEKLGPADRLAAAYRAELLMHRQPAGRSELARQVGMVGALAGTSIASFFVIVLLGAVGISFLLSGVAIVVAGLVLPAIPASLISTPFTILTTQQILIVIGFAMVPLGLLSLAGLRAYVKFLRRAVVSLLAKIRTGAPAAAV